MDTSGGETRRENLMTLNLLVCVTACGGVCLTEKQGRSDRKRRKEEAKGAPLYT